MDTEEKYVSLWTQLTNKIKPLFGIKVDLTRTPEGYDVQMYDEFHRLNRAVQRIENQIGGLYNIDYHDSFTLELQSKKFQRDVIFKRLKEDFYINHPEKKPPERTEPARTVLPYFKTPQLPPAQPVSQKEYYFQ